MTREAFVRLVGAIKESMDRNDKVDEAIMGVIEKYKPTSACFAMFADEGIVTQAVFDFIREDMGTEAKDMVEWWLYEVPMMEEEYRYVVVQGTKVFVDTPEKLWEAITWTIS